MHWPVQNIPTAATPFLLDFCGMQMNKLSSACIQSFAQWQLIHSLTVTFATMLLSLLPA
jgi:hypothetical protein